jgi:hypothetical protein
MSDIEERLTPEDFPRLFKLIKGASMVMLEYRDGRTRELKMKPGKRCRYSLKLPIKNDYHAAVMIAAVELINENKMTTQRVEHFQELLKQALADCIAIKDLDDPDALEMSIPVSEIPYVLENLHKILEMPVPPEGVGYTIPVPFLSGLTFTPRGAAQFIGLIEAAMAAQKGTEVITEPLTKLN